MPRDCTDNDREKLTKAAKKSAIQRVDEALDSVKDPMVLLQYLAQVRETLEFSSRLLHRWPSNEDHDEYRLEWASASIRDKVADQLKDDALRKIMRKLLDKPHGSASGLIFVVPEHDFHDFRCKITTRQLERITPQRVKSLLMSA